MEHYIFIISSQHLQQSYLCYCNCSLGLFKFAATLFSPWNKLTASLSHSAQRTIYLSTLAISAENLNNFAPRNETYFQYLNSDRLDYAERNIGNPTNRSVINYHLCGWSSCIGVWNYVHIHFGLAVYYELRIWAVIIGGYVYIRWSRLMRQFHCTPDSSS